MPETIHLLCAEDDDEDWMLLEEAIDQCSGVKWHRVVDGQELLDYLRNSGPLPHMIMLDLQMPKRNGFWALEQIREDPLLKHIPVTVMTTSEAETDIVKSYAIGANVYLVKPPSFEDMAALLAKACEFWTQVARIPGV